MSATTTSGTMTIAESVGEAGAAAPLILVVDDELGYREGIRRILEGRGYKARAAASGAEAIRLACEGDFPILLVDLKMPEVDGFEVIEKVRAKKPDTLCIVVSAFATIESAVQTTKMGALDFVVKPFVPDDLMLVVNRAAEKWRLACEAARLRAEREAKMLELAVEKSRVRTIIQSIAEGLLVVNKAGDVVLDNPMTRRLLGRVHEARLSCPVNAVIGDARFLGEIDRMLRGATGEVGVTIELRLRGVAAEEEGTGAGGGDGERDGAGAGAGDGAGASEALEERYLRATLAPIRDEHSETLGVVVLLADITDVKALERMKLLFVSMVAHELKAPIGAVEGYLSLLKGGSLDADATRRGEVLDRCLLRTGSLLELINDLLEITRRDVGRHERRIEPLDLAELCKSSIEFHRNEADKRRVTLELECKSGVPRIAADRGDLERILTNFLSNAIKYNKDGGKVSVRLAQHGPLVVLEVEDTGIGMALEERRRLGEEFFRAKNPKTRAITGTGLGIALVKKIVESYHGVLQVESTPEVGSTFRVLLPWGKTAAGEGEGR